MNRAGTHQEHVPRRHGSRRRRPWPLLGLLLTLAFLTHDVAMAGDIHRAAALASHDAHLEPQARASATFALDLTAGGSSAAEPCDCAGAEAPDECDVVRVVVFAPGDKRIGSPRWAGMAPDPFLDQSIARQPDWPAAGHPRAQGVRRALLQVYRI
jgi:hypothetical protein